MELGLAGRINLNENEHGQILVPNQLPPFEGVDDSTLSKGVTYDLNIDITKAIGKLQEDTNWIRDEVIHICKMIIIKLY